MRFFIAAAIIIVALFLFDRAHACIPPKAKINPFCAFEPYNHPVIPLQDYWKYQRMTPAMKLKYLKYHMWKQCGYIPKGSLEKI